MTHSKLLAVTPVAHSLRDGVVLVRQADRGRPDCGVHEEPDEPVFPVGAARRRQCREADERHRGPLRADQAGQYSRANEPDRGRDHQAARCDCLHSRRFSSDGPRRPENECGEDSGRQHHRSFGRRRSRQLCRVRRVRPGTGQRPLSARQDEGAGQRHHHRGRPRFARQRRAGARVSEGARRVSAGEAARVSAREFSAAAGAAGDREPAAGASGDRRRDGRQRCDGARRDRSARRRQSQGARRRDQRHQGRHRRGEGGQAPRRPRTSPATCRAAWGRWPPSGPSTIFPCRRRSPFRPSSSTARTTRTRTFPTRSASVRSGKRSSRNREIGICQ